MLTFGYCAAFQTMYPMAPGVIIQHNGTGTNFVVTSVGSPLASSRCHPATYVMVTATQQNNLNVVPGTNNFLSNNITAAALTGYSSRIGGPLITLPTRLFFGSFTAGDATVANVQGFQWIGRRLDAVPRRRRLVPWPRKPLYKRWRRVFDSWRDPDVVADRAYPHEFERRDERKPRLDRHERPGAKQRNISNLSIRITAVITLARNSAFICLALAVTAPARASPRGREPR